MSRPRISPARAAASSGLFAIFTPPALPRPPVFTCALTTTTGVPSSAAAAEASSGVTAVMPRRTGTPCFSKTSLAWYSYRSTLASMSVSARRSPSGGAERRRRRWRSGLSLVVTPGRSSGCPDLATQRLSGRGPATFARTQSTISAMVDPGVKTCATPISASWARSASGMMPPPNTTMSPRRPRRAGRRPDGTASGGRRTGRTGRPRRRPRPAQPGRSARASGAGPCR